MKTNAIPRAELARHVQSLRDMLSESRAQMAALLERIAHEEARRQQYAAIVETSRDAIWSWNIEM